MPLRSIDIETFIPSKEKEGTYDPILNAQDYVLGGTMFENGKYFQFTDPLKQAQHIFNDIIQQDKYNKRVYYYGHNTAYDYYGIFQDYLKNSEIIKFSSPEGKNYEIKFFCLNPFIAICNCIEPNGYERTVGWFLDTMAYYKMALKAVGDMLGYPKLEMPETITHVSQLSEYLKRDCEVTLKGILEIKKTINKMGFYPKRFLTAGNTAMTTFQTYARKNNLHWVFSYAGKTFQGENCKETREAYRGGRTECFQKGKFENCIKIDCNSMYPSVMTKMEFPALNTEFKIEGSKCEDFLNMLGVVQCTIQAPEASELDYGYLPIRFGGMVHFPLGKTLNGTWTTLEINKALSLGYKITKYHWGIFYRTAELNPFETYIQTLWKERQDSEGVKKQVIKLLMNSLSGKWAQMRQETELKLIPRSEMDKYEELGFEFVKQQGHQYLVRKLGEYHLPRYANPIVSCLITAKGRDILYDTMCKIPKEELIYVATDGIIFKPSSSKGLNSIDTYNISIGLELGEFKVEGQGTCKIYGENRYKFNEDIHIGGIPKRDLTDEVFEKGTVTIKKMVSIHASQENNALKGKIGTFVEETKEISQTSKNDVPLPNYLDEVGIKLDTWYR